MKLPAMPPAPPMTPTIQRLPSGALTMLAAKLTGGSFISVTLPVASIDPILPIPRIVNHRLPRLSSASDEGWITAPCGSGGGGGGGGGFSTTHPAAIAMAARHDAIIAAIRIGRVVAAVLIRRQAQSL